VADGTGPSGHCQPPDFQFLDKDMLKRAVPSTGDPAFYNADAVRALQIL
jgi:hypothetical protein